MEGLFGWPVLQNLRDLTPSHTAVYYSRPLGATKIRSISRLQLAIQSNSRNPQMIAYLFDQPPSGKAQLITQGSVEASSFQGDKALVDLEFTAIAYDLAEGHRIALVVDTLDWDFYTPPGQNNSFTILEGTAQPSILRLGFE